MIASVRNKALKEYWEQGRAAAIKPEWRGRVKIILNALEAATKPEDLDLPGLKFHALGHDRAGTYSVLVSRNWRITFGWDGEDAMDVDLEDYHGR